MACEVSLAAEAESNLDAAVSYLVEALCRPGGAASLLDDFDRLVATLSQFPEAFPVSDEPRLRALDIRKATFNNYVALYKALGGRVIIEHIFHQRQDYASLV